jgi:hypothetical protein
MSYSELSRNIPLRDIIPSVKGEPLLKNAQITGVEKTGVSGVYKFNIKQTIDGKEVVSEYHAVTPQEAADYRSQAGE